MVDREKVIDGLKRCEAGDKCAGCPYGPLNWAYCTGCLAQDALKLLKEQEAKEPLIIKKDVVDEIYDYIAECPECGMMWAMWHDEKMRYCPGCGKAVKWE